MLATRTVHISAVTEEITTPVVKESDKGSIAPATGDTVKSSSLDEHPDEERLGQLVHTSTPAKDGASAERVSRDHQGLPGNVVKAGAEISREKLCWLRDMVPVPGTVVWGTSVLERPTKYLLR